MMKVIKLFGVTMVTRVLGDANVGLVILLEYNWSRDVQTKLLVEIEARAPPVSPSLPSLYFSSIVISATVG